MILFGAPYSDAHRGTLPAGEIVTLRDDPADGATAVGAVPDRYKELEGTFVPAVDRMNPKYGNYVLILDLDSLARDFEPMPDAAA